MIMVTAIAFFWSFMRNPAIGKFPTKNPGGDAGLSPRPVGIFCAMCRKRAAGFPLPGSSFRFSRYPSPFLYPVFAIIIGALKHLFTAPRKLCI
jgi:hypothetical protein